jgi:dTDP-4-dehydrorhamnose 3,5-epimerase
MKLSKTTIPGCYELEFISREDARGSFVKTFHTTAFRELGLESGFSEGFYSVSHQNVLRGMHFQLPPMDGAKLVYCLQGRILDVALDLRTGSPSYGKFTTFQLSSANPTAAYIPRGVAHGFYSLSEPSVVVYQVSSEYEPNLDTGVRWDSFGFDWPNTNPGVSERDSKLVRFNDFMSPFRFAPIEMDI